MHCKIVSRFFLLVIATAAAYNICAQQLFVNTGNVNLPYKQALQEKIFVHTDKSFYVAGEILWFKLYNVSADSLKPLNLSNIAYVEVLNADEKPVLQTMIGLKEGTGNGSFYLTSSLASGNYTFRAYTNWMKNFSADKYFQKQITIINTLIQLKKTPHKDSGNYTIAFFPEGGDLVDNIESKVAFKLNDEYGNGINCKATIVDENRNSVVSFSTFKFGTGAFYFTPQPLHTYTAIINVHGKTITAQLPAAQHKGYVMHASGANNGAFIFTINSNTNIQHPVYLLIHNNYKVSTALMQQTSSTGSATFNINQNSMQPGIWHCTVFSYEKKPVCERLIFIKGKQMPLNLTADINVYDTRSKVTLNAAAKDSSNMSLAVYQIDSLQNENGNNIINYLWLTSELNGGIEQPQYYFGNNSDADSALENLLLAQGWSRFKNDTSATPLLRFAPERQGHIIEGTVTDKTSARPTANIRVYLSVPGQHYRFATATSNSNGKVYFDVKDFYGAGEIIVQTAKEDSMYRIEIADPFSNKISNATTALPKLDESKLQQLSQHNLAMQVQNAFAINELNKFSSPVLDSTGFYGAPDAKYFLNNYVRFNTMEEVLREYVAGVNVKLRQSNYSLSIIDSRNHNVFENNPLVLVDGVPLLDMNKVIAYSPLKIKKAEVVTRRYYINSFIANGILSYSTYKGDLDGFEFDPGTVELSYNGLQLQREFYSPQYNNAQQKQSRLPDYRNVLYWAPVVKNNTPISFYTSDVKGKYIAVVQGLSLNGAPGYSTVTFEVQ